MNRAEGGKAATQTEGAFQSFKTFKPFKSFSFFGRFERVELLARLEPTLIFTLVCSQLSDKIFP
jgi:hypothetical protein